MAAQSFALPTRRWPISGSGTAVERRLDIDAGDGFEKLAQRETIAAHRDKARRRPGDDQRLAHRVDPAGIAGIDIAVLADDEMRQVGSLDPRRK